MPPTIAELIDALPPEIDQDRTVEQELRQLAARLAGRPVPTGRLGRIWTFGTLPAKIAAGYIAWWARSFIDAERDGTRRTRRLEDTHVRAALKLVGEMSYLRGAFMKLGQVLANHPDVVPEQFAAVLGRLFFEAPPMHFSLLREHVRNELDAEPEELFDDFERSAFAAASLGQVHRARLKGSGQQVAVKIQYPGIARTIRDDFRAFKVISSPMRLSSDWDNIEQQLDDVVHMLELEIDYEHEAQMMETARSMFREDDEIIVPRVVPELSTRRVLTMQYIEGDHLEQFLKKEPSQPQRDRHGHQIAMAVHRLSYHAHLLYADLHPGNFLFLRDGRLGLIDFGCCHRYTPDDVEYLTQVEHAVDAPETLRDALIRGADLTPRQQRDEARLELMERWCRWVWRPMFLHEGPFDFSDEAYFREGVELFGELVKRRYVRSLPVNTWLTKNFFGLRAMLHHLGARVDLNGIVAAESTVR